MGSTNNERICTVLVTGFEAFQESFPVNPSFEIVRALPDTLTSTSDPRTTLRIIKHESPVRVVYEHVRELIPPLLDSYKDEIDMVLHIGMASGRRFYTMERYAHRDEYTWNKDLDDKILPGDDGLKRFGDCPAVMTTSLNYNRVWADWRDIVMSSQVEDIELARDELRQSDDAGLFMCDYIYFNSLAWYGRAKNRMQGGKVTDRPVMFLHVPGESDEKTLAKGYAVATGLLKAMTNDVIYCDEQA